MSQTTSQTCAYEYTVRRGDSFYLIAHRLGVPLKLSLIHISEPTRRS